MVALRKSSKTTGASMVVEEGEERKTEERKYDHETEGKLHGVEGEWRENGGR